MSLKEVKMKTLDEYIAELQALAKEHGGDLEVMTAEGEEPMAEYMDEDPEDPCIVVG
jgi:hypothetical protein